MKKRGICFENNSSANFFADELVKFSTKVNDIKIVKKLRLGEGYFPKCKIETDYYVTFEVDKLDRQEGEQLSKLVSKYDKYITHIWTPE